MRRGGCRNCVLATPRTMRRHRQAPGVERCRAVSRGGRYVDARGPLLKPYGSRPAPLGDALLPGILTHSDLGGGAQRCPLLTSKTTIRRLSSRPHRDQSSAGLPRADQTRIHCEAIAADQPLSYAAPNSCLKQLPQQVAVAKAPMPDIGEGGVAWYQPSKPSPQNHLWARLRWSTYTSTLT
jgi:hypothetical protein